MTILGRDSVKIFVVKGLRLALSPLALGSNSAHLVVAAPFIIVAPLLWAITLFFSVVLPPVMTMMRLGIRFGFLVILVALGMGLFSP